MDVADDADDAAVALAAAVFADAGGDDLGRVRRLHRTGTRTADTRPSWLELLDLSRWVL